MNIVVPRHVWEAAVRIVTVFNAITAQEKRDAAMILDEEQRQAQPGRRLTAP